MLTKCLQPTTSSLEYPKARQSEAFEVAQDVLLPSKQAAAKAEVDDKSTAAME